MVVPSVWGRCVPNTRSYLPSVGSRAENLTCSAGEPIIENRQEHHWMSNMRGPPQIYADFAVVVRDDTLPPRGNRRFWPLRGVTNDGHENAQKCVSNENEIALRRTSKLGQREFCTTLNGITTETTTTTT